MPDPDRPMTVRDEIRRVLEASGARLPDRIDDHTSLIHSGILDSTALFDVALWVEERIGGALDLTAFDLAEEWDTVAKLEAFIVRHARAGDVGPT